MVAARFTPDRATFVRGRGTRMSVRQGCAGARVCPDSERHGVRPSQDAVADGPGPVLFGTGGSDPRHVTW
jgi:hypothetical protein